MSKDRELINIARQVIEDEIEALIGLKNYIDEKSVMMEIMYSIKRAGANSIITYHALEIAEILKNNEV